MRSKQIVWTDLPEATCPAMADGHQICVTAGRPSEHSFAVHAGNLQRVDRQMFMLLWGPTIAAVSVILDHAEDTMVVRQALDSTLLCARIASCHRLDEVKCRPLTAESTWHCMLCEALAPYGKLKSLPVSNCFPARVLPHLMLPPVQIPCKYYLSMLANLHGMLILHPSPVKILLGC